MLAGAIGLGTGSAAASVLQVCDDRDTADAAQRDRQLRFAAVVREHLEASDVPVAIVSRAGLALDRFGMRYSHAGIILRQPADASVSPWAVRQLYFDCQEARPRLFDQGLSAFVFGAEQPDAGWLSVLLLPAQAARPLARAVANDATALSLLHPHYSANAYAWGQTFQNCNQWVAELLAVAWGADTTGAAPAGRAQAQAWLQQAGFAPSDFPLTPALLLAGLFVPWLHTRDHPSADVDALRMKVTMPAALEAFVQRQHPSVRRLEFCYTPERIVVRQDGPPLGDDCRPGEDDREIRFDDRPAS